jgi:hypothetical protein
LISSQNPRGISNAAIGSHMSWVTVPADGVDEAQRKADDEDERGDDAQPGERDRDEPATEEEPREDGAPQREEGGDDGHVPALDLE